MPRLLSIACLEDQPYSCHLGNQSALSCAFHLIAPTRTKIIPYSLLMSIDVIGERSIILRYSMFDVEMSLSKDFPSKGQFLDDFSNFRLAALREGRYLKMRILMEPNSEKSELF